MSQQNFHKNHFFVFHLFEFDVFIYFLCTCNCTFYVDDKSQAKGYRGGTKGPQVGA